MSSFLLRNGANVHEKKSGGWTVLHKACETGRVDVVKTLLAFGWLNFFSHYNFSQPLDCFSA